MATDGKIGQIGAVRVAVISDHDSRMFFQNLFGGFKRIRGDLWRLFKNTKVRMKRSVR